MPRQWKYLGNLHPSSGLMPATYCYVTLSHRPDDEEEDQLQAAIGCAKISQFFGPKTQEKAKRRHRFFEERGLKTVTDF